jgi:hypothetical protein
MHRSTLSLAVLLSLSLAPPGAEAAAPPPAPGLVNGDFEQGAPGRLPRGWLLPAPARAAGYTAQLTDDRPHGGRRCAVLASAPGDDWQASGTLLQRVPARPYRGRRVRFRAAVRAEVEGPLHAAGLWLRVERPGGRPGFYADMAGRSITARTWRVYEVHADVADDAEAVVVGLRLRGAGRVWLDSATLTALGRAGAGNEPPRPLTGRGLANLIAFTRLLGYVRYFHPSDEAAAADWDRVAIEGSAAVESAATPAELAARLTERFAPLAPTVRVFPSGRRPPLPAELAAPPKGLPRGAWRHLGVGIRGLGASAYRSTRVTDRAEGATAKMPVGKEALPRPDEPFAAELGGGVSCLVPLALYADARGTLPRATARPRPPRKPADFLPSGNDRATRLAGVVLAWNVLQHFYPYFDVVETDWPAALRTALKSAAIDPDAADFRGTLERLVAALHDGHGSVSGGVPPADASLPLAWDWIEGRLVVTVVDAGAGRVRPGDVVRAINGRPTADCIRAAEERISAATAQWKRHRALQDLRNGRAGEAVKLDLQSPGGTVSTVTLQRVASARSGPRGPNLREHRLPKVHEVEPGVWYVDLDRVSEADFRAALPRLSKGKAVVFDLRGYPASFSFFSHLSNRPLQSAQWHIPIVRFPDRRHLAFETSDWKMPPRRPRLPQRVAFLTDGRAISAAETVLAIIAHYKLAAIVGGPTAGTNGNVNPFVLPGGYEVRWTGMKVLQHDGSRHHGLGIRPTVPVARTIKGVAAGRDEVLERALALVRPMARPAP